MLIIKFALIQLCFAAFMHVLYRYTKLKNAIEYTAFKRILFPISFAFAYIITGMLQFI